MMMNALSLQIQTKEYFLRDKPQKSEIVEKSESGEKSEKESEVGEEQSVVKNELKKGRKCPRCPRRVISTQSCQNTTTGFHLT